MKTEEKTLKKFELKKEYNNLLIKINEEMIQELNIYLELEYNKIRNFKSENPEIKEILNILKKENIENFNLTEEEIIKILRKNKIKDCHTKKYIKIYNEYIILEQNCEKLKIEYDTISQKKANEIRQKIKKLEEEIILENDLLVNIFIEKNSTDIDMEIEDLLQICYFGLAKAVRTYDIDRNTEFSLYANTCINNEVLKNTKKRARENEYYKKQNIKKESLDNIDEYSKENIIDFPYENIENEELKNEITKILDILSEKEEKILKLKYGFENGKEHSINSIAKRLNCSKATASNYEKKALEKLKEHPYTKNMKPYLKK